MINQLFASLFGARFTLSSILLIWMSFVLPAFAAPKPVKIDFKEQGGMLEFSLIGTQGTISRQDLSFALSDDRKTLLKIELANAEIDRKKYWIKSFSESKSDADIKGIMVRQDKSTQMVQIRVRYKKRVPLSEKDQIKLVEVPNGLKVIAPRTYNVDPIKNAPSALNTKSDIPKPSLDPKLSKINTLTSSLKDEPKGLKPSTTQGQSIFDQGKPTAPLPSIEPLRSTGVLSSNKVVDQMPIVSVETLNTKPTTTVLSKKPTPLDSPILTAKSLNQESMSSQDVKDLSPKAGQSDSITNEPPSVYDLEQWSSLMSYVVLFLVLLWSASFFLKRGKSLDSEDLGNAITIRSQKVVSLSPRQRIMVVETMGHTFVVGSCERGGLSHIAHLSTPNGPVGGSAFAQQPQPDYNQRDSSLDALSRFNNQDSYYANHSYPIEDQTYGHHANAAEVNVTFEENTFVGEDEAFTAEIEPLNSSANLSHPMVNSDAYQQSDVHLSMDHLDQYSRQEELNTHEENAVAGFEVGNEEDVNMKPGDLLQWIQKLNGTKG